MSTADAAERAFWASRPVLTHIRTRALAAGASPWAVLGGVLLHTAAATGPEVTVEALRGNPASLNYFATVVGPPSQGKGLAVGCARRIVQFRTCAPGTDPLDVEPPATLTLGSGEGIARTFAPPKDDDTPPTRRAVFEVMESGTLRNLAARKGSTVMEELRKAYMGEALGFANASQATRTNIPEGTYRMCVIMCAQPSLCGFLLDDADGGTPQRFVWLPAGDPSITPADIDDARATVRPGDAPWTVDLPYASSFDERMKVPNRVTGYIQGLRDAAVRQPICTPVTLDGHEPLTRLKTAALLALLDGRGNVNDEDWDLAGVIMGVSRRTRREVLEAIDVAEEAKAVARGTRRGREQAVAAEAKDDEIRKRIRDRLITRANMAADRGETLTVGVWRNAVRPELRGRSCNEIADELINTGVVESYENERGTLCVRHVGG